MCQDADSDLYIRAKCLPEMRKDRVYLIVIGLDSLSHEVLSAQCGCAAGMGPKASCKHIAALCYALEEFTRLRHLPEFLTCTDKLQTWNQPRPRKLQTIPVESLRQRKQELKPPKKRSQATRVTSEFDPRPEFLKASDPQPMEQLRCSLLSLNKPCAFLHILVPDIGKIAHDHNYAQRPCVGMSQTASVPIILPSSDIVTERTLSPEEVVEGKQIFGVSAQQRREIEENTRVQSLAKEWYYVRAKRITSSICGRILTQKRKTVALLRL